MDTLGDILTIKFVGNWRDDAEKFTRINKFLSRPDISPQDKFKADLYANHAGMGITSPIAYPGDAYYENWGRYNDPNNS